MFVIALAMVLAANGPICQKFCGDDEVAKRLEICQGTADELQKDVDFCKASWKRMHAEHESIEKYLTQKGWQCEERLSMCQAKKKVLIKKKKAVVVVKEEVKPCCQVAPVVNVTVINNQAQAQAQVSDGVSLWKRERPSWLLGLRGGVGTAFCAPAVIGLVGVRANYLPLHLGADVYTEFWSGTGAQLLVYPIQSQVAMWHINGGFIWFNQRPFLLPTLPRQVDLTLGTGLELRVLPFLWVTADLVVRMPNPVAISQSGEQFGDVFVKSLVQTQGMLGLMLRTW